MEKSRKKLPAGWEMKTLGEVCNIIYGYTEKASFEEIGPKFLRITDIQDFGVNWDTVPFCKITDSDFEKYKLNSGDIVFARTGATTGKSYLVKDPKKSVFASYLIKVSNKNKEVLSEYLYQYFQTKTYWDTINAGVSGSAQGGFNASKLADLTIPIPPLAEQQRIVVKLDEAFAEIATAKANIERNLQNCKEVFQSELTTKLQLKKGWQIKTLGEICNIMYGYTEKASFEEIGPKFLRITDIQDSGVDWNTVPFCKITDSDFEKYKLSSGDIVFARTGATTGKSYLLKNPQRSVFASYLIKLSLANKEVLPQYLYNYFQTKTYWDVINSGVSGSAQGGFNASKLAMLKIPVPLLSEQKLIVEKLEVLSTQCKQLEDNYQQKLSSLEELKKSILQKAFCGEL